MQNNPSLSLPRLYRCLVFIVASSLSLLFTAPGASAQPNQPPVAVAKISPNLAVDPKNGRVAGGGVLITLDGSGSSDPDGDDAALTYMWTQVSGTNVTLSDTTAQSPTFTTPPRKTTDQQLVFHLSVTDEDGASSPDFSESSKPSAPSSNSFTAVTVAALARTVPLITFTPSEPQTLRAGNSLEITVHVTPAKTVTPAETATPAETSYTYAWTIGSHPGGITISDADKATVTIAAANNAQRSRDLQMQLVVTDTSSGLSTTAAPPVVSVDAAPPVPDNVPVAVAATSPNLAVDPKNGRVAGGVVITLDGSGSCGPDGAFPSTRSDSKTPDVRKICDPSGDDTALTYAWSQIRIGDAPTVELTDPASARPTFTTPSRTATDQTLLFQLVVTDPATATATATKGLSTFDLTSVIVAALAINLPPTISGMSDTTVAVDEAYSFTPTGADPDVDDTLTYKIANEPSWATFDSATGKLSGTPTNTDVTDIDTTSDDIVISVTDGIIETPVSLPAFSLAVTSGAPLPGGLTQPLLGASGGSLSAAAPAAEPYTPTHGHLEAVRQGLPSSGEDTATLTITAAADTQGTPDLQIQLVVTDTSSAASTTSTPPPVAVNAAPPVLNPEADDGSATEAVFRGGASSDDGDNYFKDGAFSVGEALDIVFVITPRAVDVGEQASVVIVVGASSDPEAVWLLTESGLLPYDGETLVSFRQGLALEVDNFITLTPEEPVTLSSAEVGNWELFIAYRLADGELFEHLEPLRIEVME